MRDPDAWNAAMTEGTLAKFELTFFRPIWPVRLLPRWLLTPIWDPKIFHVLQPRPSYRLASLQAWQSTIWQSGVLSRAVREAIAVAVSTANRCLY
jgi:hypothetical protein